MILAADSMQLHEQNRIKGFRLLLVGKPVECNARTVIK